MDELKIYCRMEAPDIFPGDDAIAVKLREMTDQMNTLILEKMKYSIMWRLRSIEHEYKASGGSITLEITDFLEGIKVRKQGFSDGLVRQIDQLLNYKSP